MSRLRWSFRALRLAASIAVLAFAGCGGETPAGGNVLVILGDVQLSHADFQAYVERNVERNVNPGDSEQEGEREPSETPLESAVLSRLFDQFLEERLLVRLAHDQGLEKEQKSQRAAVDFLIQAAGALEIGASEIQSYYENHREEFQRPEQVRLRQILVADAKIAAEAREAILEGEDFAVVAARTSEEPQAARGGDQGRLGRDDLPPAFADIIFNLEPGDVSDIIAADYGYHLFQVVERYPAQLVSLAAAREQIEEKLLRQRADELVAGFVQTAKERYHVEVFRNHFPFDYQGGYAG